MSGATIDQYEILEEADELNLKYLFISKGKKPVVKAIEYIYVDKLQAYRIFNLAFGDYEIHEDKINDLIDTNNGDGRKVLRTVLATVPKFFERFSKDILMVTGCDSTEEYRNLCIRTCTKFCTNAQDCKNRDRRIKVYNNYVSLNYADLTIDYSFFGGLKINNELHFVPYAPSNKYDAVFVIKK